MPNIEQNKEMTEAMASHPLDRPDLPVEVEHYDEDETLVLAGDNIAAGIKSKSLKTQEEYDQEAGEVDLFDLIDKKLKAKGIDEEDWTDGRFSESDYEVIKQTPMSYQRLLINRILNRRLSEYDSDTRDVRYCLISKGSLEDWETLIDREVIPCIVKHEKPEPKLVEEITAAGEVEETVEDNG